MHDVKCSTFGNLVLCCSREPWTKITNRQVTRPGVAVPLWVTKERMFETFASKLGEAKQAFADGLGNFDALSMDRLREQEEMRENARRVNIRRVNTEGGVENSEKVDGEHETSTLLDHQPLSGEQEEPKARADLVQKIVPQASVLFSSGPSASKGAAESEASFAIDDQDFATTLSIENENFEDEFDPILASVRKSRQASQETSTSPAVGTPVTDATSPDGRLSKPPVLEEKRSDDRGKSNVGVSFAAGLLSVFPGDIRARAGDIMAQSSAQVSKSAGALRSALETGVPSLVGTNSKRPRDGNDTGGVEMEEGRGGSGSSRRAMANAKPGGEDDVRTLNANELLSDEERQQLALLSGGAGGGSGFFACRRLRKYLPVVAGVAFLGVIYLWRWRVLPANTSGATGGIHAVGHQGL